MWWLHLLITLAVIALFVVLSAMSAHGMHMHCCKVKCSFMSTWFMNLMNSWTFGIFGIMKFLEHRNDECSMSPKRS